MHPPLWPSEDPWPVAVTAYLVFPVAAYLALDAFDLHLAIVGVPVYWWSYRKRAAEVFFAAAAVAVAAIAFLWLAWDRVNDASTWGEVLAWLVPALVAGVGLDAAAWAAIGTLLGGLAGTKSERRPHR
jgi:hypothetical protein